MTIQSNPKLLMPAYEPSDCSIGVAHLGFGAFHRAHQAVYLDAYMSATGDTRWGVAAINLRLADRPSFDAARSDDGYVLKTISTDGEVVYRNIACHRQFADWSADAAGAEAIIAQPNVTMITITVTESGYYLKNDGSLDASNPLMAAEAAGTKSESVYAFLRQALNRRRAANAGAINILCCDNLRGNGHLLDRNFKAYLAFVGDNALLEWLAVNASFPASMVDRITPKPTPTLMVESKALFNRDADATIMGEDFIQWVIEDKFVAARPELEKVGVTITGNIDPYEETKIRILNGGHTCLAYLGALAGYDSFDELMRDDTLLAHFMAYETEEVLPALNLDLPFDKKDYLDIIMHRFCNSHIADSVERICTDGFAKFPIFIAPTLQGCFAMGIAPKHGIRSVASWYVFARRSRDGSMPTRYIEPNLAQLTPLLADGAFTAFAQSEVLWGQMAKQFPEFEMLLSHSIEEVERTWPL